MAASATPKKVKMMHKHHGNDLLRKVHEGDEFRIEEEKELALERDRIRHGSMEKKVLNKKGVLWQPRFAVLTLDRLSFTIPGDSDIIDYIPLHEIHSVELQHEYVDPTLAAEANLARVNSIRSSSISSLKVLKEHQSLSDGESIWEWHLVISTIDDGHNAGRSYILRVPAQHAAGWLKDLDTNALEARRSFQERMLLAKYGHSKVAMLRAKSLMLYESPPFQYMVSALIVASFMCDLSEAQVSKCYFKCDSDSDRQMQRRAHKTRQKHGQK